jgi:hypothetical protein
MSRQNKPDPNYETMLTMSQNFTEISSMTETNSEHITSLISLIKSQNKSLQSLQQQVYKLQSKIGEEDDAECSDTEEDEEKIQVSEVFCDLCEDRHTALYYCKDCSENLCETIAGIHKKGKATKGHLVLLLSDIEKEPDVDGSYEVPIYKESYTRRIEDHAFGLIFSRKGKIYINSSGGSILMFSKTDEDIRKINHKSDGTPSLLILDSSDSVNIYRNESFNWILYTCPDEGNFQEKLVINKPGKPKKVTGRDQNGFPREWETIELSPEVDGYFFFSGIQENNNVIMGKNNTVKIFDKDVKKFKCFCISLHTDIVPPQIKYAKISPKDEIFIVDRANHIVKVFSKEGVFLRTIGRPARYIFNERYVGARPNKKRDNLEFDFYNDTDGETQQDILQFSDRCEVFIGDRNRIQVFSQQGAFLYKIYESRTNIKLFTISPSQGNIAVILEGDNHNIHIFEVTGKYSKNPETHFTLNTTLVQDSEILTDTKVSSVTFPISIKRDSNDNLFTRTLYFPQPISVKGAIHEVEEYFRKRITREEFNDVRSVCNFSSLQGELRGDYMNWDACKKAKIIRGYFLGGEIIQELRLNEGNLFIHITDCFVSLN